MKPKSDKLFCLTTVHELKPEHQDQFSKAFIDDMKFLGIPDQAFQDLQYNGRAFWSDGDKEVTTIYAAEIVDRNKKAFQ